MSRVIGGEFSIDAKMFLDSRNLGNNTNAAEIFGDLIYRNGLHRKIYSCGRAALRAIISMEEYWGGVLLPNYLCSSISKTVKALGCRYQFYEINKELLPDIDDLMRVAQTNEFTFVLLINYFGLVDLTDVIGVIRKQLPDIRIILDDVQNYYGFGSERDFDFCFTSLRKWFPMPDGAICYAKKYEDYLKLPEYSEDNQFVEKKLVGNMLKSFEGLISDDLCLRLCREGEEVLDREYMCKVSSISPLLFKTIKFNEIAKKRMHNAKILHQTLISMGIEHVFSEGKVPLFVPIFIHKSEKRDLLRKHFFDNNIFCPIHWPQEGKDLSGENELYQSELSLICDQRYGADDMKRILEILSYEY